MEINLNLNLSELPKASSFNINKVVFSIYGPFNQERKYVPEKRARCRGKRFGAVRCYGQEESASGLAQRRGIACLRWRVHAVKPIVPRGSGYKGKKCVGSIGRSRGGFFNTIPLIFGGRSGFRVA